MLLMRSGSKVLCVSLCVAGSRQSAGYLRKMPVPVTSSCYFLSRPAEIGERAPGPVRGTVEGRRGLAILEPLASRFFFTLRLPISIVHATPPPPPHHHRSLPTGCPRRPARHPSRRRTPQHHRCTPPHPVAATPRQLPPTPAVETHSANRARRTRRQQRRPRNQQTPLENRHYAGS